MVPSGDPSLGSAEPTPPNGIVSCVAAGDPAVAVADEPAVVTAGEPAVATAAEPAVDGADDPATEEVGCVATDPATGGVALEPACPAPESVGFFADGVCGGSAGFFSDELCDFVSDELSGFSSDSFAGFFSAGFAGGVGLDGGVGAAGACGIDDGVIDAGMLPGAGAGCAGAPAVLPVGAADGVGVAGGGWAGAPAFGAAGKTGSVTPGAPLIGATGMSAAPTPPATPNALGLAVALLLPLRVRSELAGVHAELASAASMHPTMCRSTKLPRTGLAGARADGSFGMVIVLLRCSRVVARTMQLPCAPGCKHQAMQNTAVRQRRSALRTRASRQS